MKNFVAGKRIKISSLDKIVKNFGLKHAVLKVDCKGCEYLLLLNASDAVLQAFDQIILEYHYGYKNLEKRLKEAGFKVPHTRKILL
ncbi:MAG: FkbM family methyltransferase [Candidatus Micrarchaeia archaeon]